MTRRPLIDRLVLREGRVLRWLLLLIWATTQVVKQTIPLRLPGVRLSRQFKWSGIFPKH